MTIKKLSGSLAAALAVFGLSGAAMADGHIQSCDDVVIDIERQAVAPGTRSHQRQHGLVLVADEVLPDEVARAQDAGKVAQ